MASPRRRPIPAATPGTVTDADEWDDIQTPCSAVPDMWFATDPDGVAYAKAVCASCPMRDACLRAVLDLDVKVGVQSGIWGGLDPDERRQMRRNAARKSRAKATGPAACRMEGCERVFPSTQARGCHEASHRRTRCREGHDFSGDNVMVLPGGERRCRACSAAYSKAWRDRQREAAS